MIASEMFSNEWNKKYFIIEVAKQKVLKKIETNQGIAKQSLYSILNNTNEQIKNTKKVIEKTEDNILLIQLNKTLSVLEASKKLTEEKIYSINTEKQKDFLKQIEATETDYFELKKKKISFFDKYLLIAINFALINYYSGNPYPIINIVKNCKKLFVNHTFQDEGKKYLMKDLFKIKDPFFYAVLGEMLQDFFTEKVGLK